MSLKSFLNDHRISTLPPAEKRWALHHAMARMNPTMDPIKRDLQIDALMDDRPRLTSRPGVFRASYDDETKGLRAMETTRVEHIRALAGRIASGEVKLLEAEGPAKFLRLLEPKR